MTRDLQDRVTRFARTTFVLALVMFVASVGIELASRTDPRENFTAPSRLVHFAALAALLGAWSWGRGAARSARALETLDTALTLFLASCWGALGLGIAVDEPIEFSMILATTYTIVVRSVTIPSTLSRTLWISSVAALPTLIVFAKRGMGFIPDASPAKVRTFLVFSTIWLLVAIVTATLNSRTLYGLRATIREIKKLGQYTLEAKIGEGGMGVVYRATHAMLRRPAAIKLLLHDRAEERDLARFEREVQLTSRLAHPNTVSIFDYGRSADGAFYYVMEYLDGVVDLQRLVALEGPIAAPRAIHILVQASGALAEAHALGLVHRDIKPANIMLTERADEPDVVKVVDFGLVRTIDSGSSDLAVTNVNAITGTPMYMAPEAITSPDQVDARTDIYALGAVAYFLLTGMPVFDAPTIIELCSKHLHEEPTPPSKRLGGPVPPDLEALVLACLAKRPDERPASGAAVRTALLACVDAERYEVDAARTWWHDRASELRRPREGHSIESMATMAINLGDRDA